MDTKLQTNVEVQQGQVQLWAHTIQLLWSTDEVVLIRDDRLPVGTELEVPLEVFDPDPYVDPPIYTVPGVVVKVEPYERPVCHYDDDLPF